MKWGLMCKPDVKKSVSLTTDILDFLKETEEEVFAEENFAKTTGIKGYSLKEINKKADIVITVGGDGTILMALTEIEKPIFAINSGGMGFLAEVESKYAMGGLSKVIKGEYNIEERAKLKILLDGKRLSDATNEVTVQTAKIAKILYLQLFVDEDLIETMGADGIIVATPTGSTSYALSVGGPIMDPAVNARPWIVPLDKTVRIKLLPKSKESKIVIDGRLAKPVTSESDMLVTISEKKSRFVRFGESFYQRVRLKLVR